MREIVETYGKVVVAVVVVIALLGYIFARNAAGELDFLKGFGEKLINENLEYDDENYNVSLVEYTRASEEIEIQVTQKLSTNARYSIYDFLMINGQVGKYASGKERFARISKLIDENGNDVVDGVFDLESKNVVFVVPGVYKAFLVVTDENGVQKMGWYAIQVISGNGVCPNSLDGLHNYLMEIKESTCVSNGYQLHICEFCGDRYRDSSMLKAGHQFIDEILTQVTCVNNGLVRHTCKVCGYIENEQIDALGHILPKGKTNGVYVCTLMSLNSMCYRNYGGLGYVIGSFDYKDVCSICGATNYHYWMLTNLNYNVNQGVDLGGNVHCGHYLCERCGKVVDSLM